MSTFGGDISETEMTSVSIEASRVRGSDKTLSMIPNSNLPTYILSIAKMHRFIRDTEI